MLRLSSRNTLDVQQILIIDISYSGPVFSRLCLALCVLAYLIHEFNTYILIFLEIMVIETKIFLFMDLMRIQLTNK